MKIDERVLCIPAAHFRSLGDFTGFRPFDASYCAALLDATKFSYQPRSICETDPEFKQLIPYVVLCHGEQVFHYRRGASGTEKRLSAKRSIGIGGHISDLEAEHKDPFWAGMLRELSEEVEIASETSGHFLGFIYDPSTPVGEVHLGIVYRLNLAQPLVTSREAGIADAAFAPMQSLLAEAEQFETWSQLTLTALLS